MNGQDNEPHCVDVFIIDVSPCAESDGVCNLSCPTGEDPDCEADCDRDRGECVSVISGEYSNAAQCNVECQDC